MLAREEIDKKVQETLQTLPTIEPFVQIGQICANLKINVRQDKNYPSNKDGRIEIDGHGKVHIIINAKKPAVRKRFTLAHEIAHFVLHEDCLKKKGIIDRDGDVIDEDYLVMEREANQFAAKLLMPKERFMTVWQALGEEPKMQDIADFFGVSKEASYYRALDLGLISAS